MDEFTPTTEQVRSHYVFDQNDKWKPERGEAFDRWLADRDKAVSENARAEARKESLQAARDAIASCGYVLDDDQTGFPSGQAVDRGEALQAISDLTEAEATS